MVLCTRKRRWKSKEDSTMYLFPALSETHVIGKNEKACVSVPAFLFTRYVTLAGHAAFLRVFSHLWKENNIYTTGQLWRASELVYLSYCTFLTLKNVKYLCCCEGIWRDGNDHWVQKWGKREGVHYCCFEGKWWMFEWTSLLSHFICMKMGVHHKSSIMTINDFKMLGNKYINSRYFWLK